MIKLQVTNPKKFIGLLLGAIVVVISLVWLIMGSGSIQKTGDFTVEAGAAASSVGKQLQSDGYIVRTLAWRYAILRADATGVQAGTYRLEKGEKIKDVVERMAKGEVVPDELTITYPEGFTIKQIAARTAGRGIGTEAEFITQAKVGDFAQRFEFLAGLPAEHSLEGYLFPDTYRVFAEDTPKDVIERMLTNFDTKVTSDIRQEAVSEDRSLDEIVIMASIIEREVNRTADLPKVADVLWKRYDDQTGLYADATIRYALNNWSDALTVQDLALDSPYNTRKYRDLPPTAIGNPGVTAMLAALRPEKTDFYYYLSAADGETIFAKTNDEHNRNKIKYLH